MSVRVIKTSQITNPIVLDVIPLTVEMAMANSLPILPDNIKILYQKNFAGNSFCHDNVIVLRNECIFFLPCRFERF